MSEELISDDPLLSLNEISPLVTRSVEHLRAVVRDKKLPHEYERGHIVIRLSIVQNYLSNAKVGRPRK